MSRRWAMLALWPSRRVLDWVDAARRGQARPPHYTSITLCVPAPRAPGDSPTLLLSLSTGPRSTVRMRLRDVRHYDQVFRLPAEVRQRLVAGLREAHRQAAELIEDDRLAMMRRAGVPLYRADTGEGVPGPGGSEPQGTPQGTVR